MEVNYVLGFKYVDFVQDQVDTHLNVFLQIIPWGIIPISRSELIKGVKLMGRNRTFF